MLRGGLTTGDAFMILDMSDHSVEGENLRKLHVLFWVLSGCLLRPVLQDKGAASSKTWSSTCCKFFSEGKSSNCTEFVVIGSYHAHNENILTALQT